MSLFKFVFHFLLICFFSSCSQDVDQKQKDAQTSQILRVCLSAEPHALHPAFGFDVRSQLLIRSLFEGLTRIHSDGTIQPALAKTISISEDKKIYTFSLKEAYWTNGLPVCAEDFAYAWKKIITSDDATLCDILYLIKNAKAIKEKKTSLDEIGIHVLDEKTVQVELQHPASFFLSLLANPIFSPICKEIDQNFPEWYQKKGEEFVCNGPFRIKGKKNGSLILEKNPFYHDRNSVKLQEIHFQFVDDPHTILWMFEKGEVDWIGEPFEKIPLEALDSFRQTNQLNMHSIAAVYWMICNVENYPLNSANIRKALAYALNRKEIVENVLIGNKAAFSLIPDKLSHLSPEKKNQDYNPDSAHEFFHRGLQELGLSQNEFPPLELTYCPSQKVLAQMIQAQLKENLGLKVNLRCSEWNICFQHYVKKQFQLGITNWVSYFADPMYHLQTFRDRASTGNWCSWENAEYQHVLDLIDQEINEEERNNYLEKAELVLFNQMPAVPLYYPLLRFVKKPTVHHAPITDLGECDLKWISIDQKPL